MLHRTFRAAVLTCALIAAPLVTLAGPISGYPAATTPLSGSETAIGTQSGSTVQITTQSIANILLSATNTWTAVQTFPAPGASKGSIVLTPGTVSGTPPNGSLWTTSSGLFFQVGGATQQAVGNGAITWTGEQSFLASAAGSAGANLGVGGAPTSPVNGDFWNTSSGLFIRDGGATHQLADLDSNTFTGEQSFAASTLSNAGVNLGQGTGPTSPVNGDLWITSSGAFARVNGVTAALGVTVPTAAAGGSNTQVQYNCSSVLCGATGFAYNGGASDNLTGPDGTTWTTSALTIGSASKLDINGTFLVSGSAPLIASPSCASGAGGATWLIGPATTYCNHATAGATDDLAFGTIIFQSLTSGCCNTMMGSENGKSITTGSYNTGIGFEADHVITTGTQNSGFGGSALDNVTTGSTNTALGYGAGAGISTGSSNVCIAGSCGSAAAMTGSNNDLIGTAANTLTSGGSNIVLGVPGSSALQGIATGNYNVWIGGQGTTLTDQSNSFSEADGQGNMIDQYLTGNGYERFWHSSRTIVTGGAFAGLTPTTVSGLATADASPSDGDTAFVTDATACTFNSAVSGSGSTHCRVHYDSSSSSWKAG